VLPNLLVIGAAKCGTTALHRYLGLHPDIFMSKSKELGFFCSSENWDERLRWYESQFGAARVRGESSPSYTNCPRNKGVPERMASLVPDARLIYLVRDPVDRVISQYRFGRWVAGYDYGEIEDMLAGVDRETFIASDLMGSAVTLKLGWIGESVTRIPGDYQHRYPHVAWDRSIEFRDLSTQRYYELDGTRIWDAATVDAPKLRDIALRMLAAEFPDDAEGGA